MPTYSCRNMPVVQEFMDNDAFMRGLMGPVGSGKSSACVMEVIQRALKQKRGPDGIRKSRWAVIRNCYDDQTEILTEKRGWQFFADLQPEDKVATLHDGERLKFEIPSDYYQAPYEGEMIGLYAEGIDLLVTPEHKLWVTKTSGRDRRQTPYRHEIAESCYGMIDWRMKRDADWRGGTDRYSLDFYEFLGLWFADGYAGVYRYPDREDRVSPHRRMAIVQRRHIDYTREVLSKAEIVWTEMPRDDGSIYFRISLAYRQMKELGEELAALGVSAQKHLPLWIKESTPEALRRFIRGYLMGDGIIRRHSGEVTQANTSSRQLADDIQEIAVRAGYVVNIRSFQHKLGFEGSVPPIIYFMTFITEKKYRPKTGSSWYRQNYNGTVYCVTVSSHVVYVRRRGVAVWSGQTQKELSDTTERTFLQWFPPHQFGIWTPSKHDYTINTLGGEGDEKAARIEIMFRALDRPDQIGDLLSLELTGAWVNEAREMPWAIIDALRARVGRYPAMRDGGASWYGIIMDTNPPDVDSEWFKFFEETDHTEAVAALAKVPGFEHMTVDRFRRLFKQPSGLSPRAENLPNLRDGYYQTESIGKSDEWIKIYVHGEYGFVMDGKAVWPEYKDEIHCPANRENWPKPNPMLPILRGWDSSGLTPACVFTQLTSRSQWIVFDEVIPPEMGASAITEAVIEHSARYYPGFEFWDVGDPAGAQRSPTDMRTFFDVIRARGIQIEPGIQTQEIRLESVRKPLRTLVEGRPQFVLHPRCKQLRRGMMGGYHYRRMKISGERYTMSPEKNQFSHVSEAMGYAATRMFGGALLSQQHGRYDNYNPGVAPGSMGRAVTTGY